MDDDSDFAKLIERLRSGDPAAVDELCRRYGPFIQAVVRRQLHPRLRDRFDSLDFVQDVWASVLAIPPERFAFDSPEALAAYLRQIAANRVTEVFRQRFQTQKEDITRERSDPSARDRVASRAPTASQRAIAAEEWERLVARFPTGQRPILERYRDGHKLEDIADEAGVSLSTINRVVGRLRSLAGL